jgi:hypothetical protein
MGTFPMSDFDENDGNQSNRGYLQYKSGLTFLIGSREAIFSEPSQNAAFCRLAGMQPNAKNVRWEPSRRPMLGGVEDPHWNSKMRSEIKTSSTTIFIGCENRLWTNGFDD